MLINDIVQLTDGKGNVNPAFDIKKVFHVYDRPLLKKKKKRKYKKLFPKLN